MFVLYIPIFTDTVTDYCGSSFKAAERHRILVVCLYHVGGSLVSLQPMRPLGSARSLASKVVVIQLELLTDGTSIRYIDILSRRTYEHL